MPRRRRGGAADIAAVIGSFIGWAGNRWIINAQFYCLTSLINDYSLNKLEMRSWNEVRVTKRVRLSMKVLTDWLCLRARLINAWDRQRQGDTKKTSRRSQRQNESQGETLRGKLAPFFYPSQSDSCASCVGFFYVFWPRWDCRMANKLLRLHVPAAWFNFLKPVVSLWILPMLIDVRTWL